MTKKALFFAIALTLAAVVAAMSQTPAAPKHRVVFQMTEPQGSAWSVLAPHVSNSRDALMKDGPTQMEVVFYGPGLTMLRKSNTEYEARLKQLAEKGVTLAACQNAMRMMNIKSEDLFPFVTEVDSGIAELVRKQEAGWAYIH